MAGKNKLMKFAENLAFGNLFQPPFEEVYDGFHLKVKWAKDFFNNSNDLVLELGCGKGEYTVGLAKNTNTKNFIGIDIKGARMWRGLKDANDHFLKNVAFIRTRINLVEYFFDKDEVSEIWITFPDPRPRELHAKKRLTSPQFLKRYQKFLKQDSVIHLKTDNILFFEYTLDVIREDGHELLYSNYDIYGSGIDNELTRIQTYYEKIWLKHGTKIKYLKFRLHNG